MKKYLDLIFIVIVAFTSLQFYYVWQQGLGNDYLYSVAYSLEERPYVYRVLIPLISRIVEATIGIYAVYCMIFLIVLSAVGLYLSLKYLFSAFESNKERNALVSFIGCEIFFMVILFTFPHIYDIPTAMFFTLAFGLLAHKKFISYFLLFPIATINRETTFLLLLFWIVYFYKKLPNSIYVFGGLFQLVSYSTIRLIITATFVDNPGFSFDWQPLENLDKLAKSPIATSILIAIFIIVIFVVSRSWSDKPLFLRTAFLVVFPVQVFLHLTLGGIWELRVYSELIPLISILAFFSWASSKNIYDQTESKISA